MSLCHRLYCLAVIVWSCLGSSAAEAGVRLDAIQARGTLVCGMASADPGFSVAVEPGVFVGLEADLCRALATVVLGEASRVRFVPLDTVHEFLAQGDIDLVFHRLTWTLSREAPGQLEFGPVYFYEMSPSQTLEPLAPLLRSDDSDFARVVRWSIFALLQAEWEGVDQRRAARTLDMEAWPPAASDLLPGLSPGWARHMVAEVGNYGEIYNRHLGPRSTLPLPRGPNRLHRDGGLFLVPLMR